MARHKVWVLSEGRDISGRVFFDVVLQRFWEHRQLVMRRAEEKGKLSWMRYTELTRSRDKAALETMAKLANEGNNI